MCRFASLAALILVFAAAAEAAPPEPKTITVTGFASMDVKPDHAAVNIGVDTSDKITAKAVAANSLLMAKVVEAISSVGVPNTAMQTSNFSIEAQHPPAKEGYGQDMTVTLGYAVSNMLAIDIDDVAKVPLIIDAAVKAGANSSNSVIFSAKDRQAFDDKVLGDAVKDARHNAEIMAAAEAAHVGKMLSVTNTGAQGFDVGSFGAAPNANRLMAPIMMAGEVTVSAGVVVVYALE